MFRLLFLLLLLCGCDSDAGLTPSENGSASHEVRGPASLESGSARKAPGEEEKATAERITAFANQAGQYLESGYFSLADKFHANAQEYLKSYRLPPRPDVGRRLTGGLAPEEGLFDEQEARDLTEGWQAMDRALNALLGHYSSLEKYVADQKVRDDGKLGRDLAAKIAASHERFVQARHAWLGIVQKRSRQAQDVLLYNHPLERQIVAAENIFEQIRAARDILAGNNPDLQILKNLGASIHAQIDLGGRPPFTASPGLERLYRNFLKAAAGYADELERGENIHNFQRRELGAAAKNCALAWNEFARAVNGVLE